LSPGQQDQVFRWLNLGKKQQCDCLVWLQSEPWMDPSGVDPRYIELVKRVFGRTPVAAKKAQKALDDHLIFHRCDSLTPKAAAATKD
jgi:hypothetical protein